MQGNVNIPDSTITTNLSFRQLVLMNMQQLTNFPYIEKDFDALTDYELLCLVVKFLNDVIANQNEQNDSITRMYQSFLALQDYVNNTKDELEDAFNNLDDYVRNYFDNLDVQDEINNKLDEMLEDGVLDEIIQQFLQSEAVWSFDTVADLKNATNLINGSDAKTLGYYSINDGGAAFYHITNSEDLNIHQELLNNGLYASLVIDDYVNIKQMGAYGNGNNDDTQIIQKALNYYNNVYIPEGTFNISQLNVNQYQHLFGCGRKSYLYSTTDNANNDIIALNIPASSDHCFIEKLRIHGGIQNGVIGTASVQDINNVFKDLFIYEGYGFRVHQRGNYLNNVRCGSTYYGIHISGTDNFIDSCITAATDKHGILVQGANNSVINCKSFMAGQSEWGVGVYVIGAFERISNCEAQQNYYENYWFNNSLSTTVSGCISDGAFWTHEDMQTYTNPILNTTLNSSAIFINNLQNGNIQIDNINGSLFGQSHAATKEVLGIKYANTIHNSSFIINSQNRNNYTNIMHDGVLYNLCSNNNLILNGVNYNSLATKGAIINEISATFTAVSQTQRMATIKLPVDSTKVAINFETIGDTTGLSLYWWDVAADLVNNGTTTNKVSSRQSFSANNPYFDIESWLSQFTYTSISAMAIRIIAISDAEHSNFTFKANNVKMWSSNGQIDNQ